MDVAAAGTQPVAGTEFALGPIALGTVRAGQTVKIEWSSTVDALTQNQQAPTFSNASTIAGGNFAQVTSNSETLGAPGADIVLDTLTIGDRVFVDAKWLREFGVRNRPQGNVFWLRLNMRLDD